MLYTFVFLIILSYFSLSSRANKLSKTSAASNTRSNRSTAPLFSQIVSSLPTMPTLQSSNSTSHTMTTPIKNQTIISNRYPRQEHPLGKVYHFNMRITLIKQGEKTYKTNRNRQNNSRRVWEWMGKIKIRICCINRNSCIKPLSAGH